MKVRVNSVYRFEPSFMDRAVHFERGAMVRVINLHGCPPANTMGMCYVVPATNAKGDNRNFAMVCTGSLEKGEQ